MNRDSIQDALNHISDKHIAEAATAKKRRYAPYIAAIAACLALVITLGIVLPKGNPSAQNGTTPPRIDVSPTNPNLILEDHLLASPVLPTMEPYPTDQENLQRWSAQEKAWQDCRNVLHSAPSGYVNSLNTFWQQSIPIYLTENGSNNAVYSPINLYMALAILAQTTGGETRQEILTLLGADNMEILSAQAKLVFENHYENDGVHTCILANSLWLDDIYPFDRTCVDKIAENFYASVYQGALESPEMNIALKSWLNEQTGGLLEDSIRDLKPMDLETALVIASTIHYRCKWTSEFNSDRNTQDVFHSPAGERTVTYLNKTMTYGTYLRGEDYSATYLSLDDGSRMWLILPDENTSPDTLLTSGQAINTILGTQAPDTQTLKINLSVPKFDISADMDLISGLKAMGLSQVFDTENGDFSSICPQDCDLYLDTAKQAVRFSIDEVGATGVAYTVLMMNPGSAMPPTEEIDFTLDRPFLFIVESSDGLPLFTGIVNQP